MDELAATRISQGMMGSAAINALGTVVSTAGQVVGSVAGSKQTPAAGTPPPPNSKNQQQSPASQKIMQTLVAQLAAGKGSVPGRDEVLCGPPTSPLLGK